MFEDQNYTLAIDLFMSKKMHGLIDTGKRKSHECCKKYEFIVVTV